MSVGFVYYLYTENYLHINSNYLKKSRMLNVLEKKSSTVCIVTVLWHSSDLLTLSSWVPERMQTMSSNIDTYSWTVTVSPWCYKKQRRMSKKKTVTPCLLTSYSKIRCVFGMLVSPAVLPAWNTGAASCRPLY